MNVRSMVLVGIVAGLIGGCATMERHPVWTAVGTAVIVGSIAATIEANRGDHRQAAGPLCAPNCAVGAIR
jgi:hypothetical protein